MRRVGLARVELYLRAQLVTSMYYVCTCILVLPEVVLFTHLTPGIHLTLMLTTVRPYVAVHAEQSYQRLTLMLFQEACCVCVTQLWRLARGLLAVARGLSGVSYYLSFAHCGAVGRRAAPRCAAFRASSLRPIQAFPPSRGGSTRGRTCSPCCTP